MDIEITINQKTKLLFFTNKILEYHIQKPKRCQKLSSSLLCMGKCGEMSVKNASGLSANLRAATYK